MRFSLLQKKNRTLASLVLLGVISAFSTIASADPLWKLVNQADYQEQLDSIQIPGAISLQQAVAVTATSLDSLIVGSSVTVVLAPTVRHDYRITARHDYLNGDTGWDAILDSGDKRYMLTLTRADNVMLASINSPTGKAWIKAFDHSALGSSYVGWLYTRADGARILPADFGGVDPGRAASLVGVPQQFEITGSDVSIEQSFSSNRIVIGEQIDVTIEITNNLASTLSNEELTVFFILDDSELLTSSDSCSRQILSNFIGSPAVLICALPDVAPQAATTINYSVQSTSVSYPFLSSGAFVGDILGDNVRNDSAVFVAQDTLVDDDEDGISNFNENILGTNPSDPGSVIADGDIPVVDLMFLYTQKYADDIGSSNPETEINQLVQLTNAIYANSGAEVIFRPVFYGATNYDVGSDLNQAFDDLKDAVSPDFNEVPANRTAVGADIVVLIDGLLSGGDICGLGTLPGIGLEGELTHPNFQELLPYITLFMPGISQSGNSSCAQDTLGHELGHNFGLNHSRREEGAEGTYPWSFGHGVNSSFVTIMANPDDFPGSTPVELFSNPANTGCNLQACGVARTDLEQGADAVHSINQTRFQIANINQSNILATATQSSAGANALFFGGASRTGQNEFDDTFTSAEAIDASVTIDIPSEHVGQTGVTHIVAFAEGVGFFQLDQQGSYIPFDGTVENLVSNIAPRPLNETEDLTAFIGLVAANEGFEAINLTMYFAYSIPNTDVFAYTADGVPIQIVAP